MIPKEKIKSLVSDYAGGDDFFVVDISVKENNVIRIFVDRLRGIDIAECVKISRFVHHALEEETEEPFELMVSSPGLDRPLQVWEQYMKNQGRQVKVKLRDGSEYKGVLKEAEKEKITLETMPAKKKKGKKESKQTESQILVIPFNQIDKTKVVITF